MSYDNIAEDVAEYVEDGPINRDQSEPERVEVNAFIKGSDVPFQRNAAPEFGSWTTYTIPEIGRAHV